MNKTFRIYIFPGLCAIVLAFVLHACTLKNPSDFRIENVFDVSISPDTLPADGYTRSVIAIELRDDTPSNVELTIKADKGTLAGFGESAPDNQSSEATFNIPARTASVKLISGTEAGIGTLLFTIGDFSIARDIALTRVLPEVLTLTADRTTADANGTDRIALSAALRLNDELRTVTRDTRVVFEARSLSTGLTVDALEREALSDTLSIAKAEIVSSTADTLYIIARAAQDPAIRDSVLVVFE